MGAGYLSRSTSCHAPCNMSDDLLS